MWRRADHGSAGSDCWELPQPDWESGDQGKDAHSAAVRPQGARGSWTRWEPRTHSAGRGPAPVPSAKPLGRQQN
jgi:hypothetical protein